MSKVPRLTISDQVAITLREGLRDGRWGEQLPGVRRLSAELGVAKATLMKAIRILEAEGSLVAKEAGEARSIVRSGKDATAQRPLRVAVMVSAAVMNMKRTTAVYPLRLMCQIQNAGHECFVVAPEPKAHRGAAALAKLTKANPADAWVLFSGNNETCAWFAASGIPVIGIGGRARQHPMAATGYSINKAITEITKRLLSLGHRRIVLLDYEMNRRGIPGPYSSALLSLLQEAGIQTGDYNHPDWKETPADFFNMLESLFRFTPPTALICMEDTYANGVISFLQSRNLQIPRDVSLICAQPFPSLDWQLGGLDLTRIFVDNDQAIKRIVRWLGGVQAGHPETGTWITDAGMHWGETIAPPPK